MLLLNKTLLKMMKGLKRWILCIVVFRLVVLLGTVSFAQSVSTFLADLFSPSLSDAALYGAIADAAVAALVMLIGQILIGEAEYMCTAKARTLLREKILDKILLLDVANIEKIGAANAVNMAASGVENMQMYYSSYLPSLVYCFIAPVYMFFKIYKLSMPIAVLLLVITMSILPANNVFRQITERLKSEYWESLRDMTSYFLEGLRGMTTLKLFNRDADRTKVLEGKAYNFYNRIMSVMKLNFKSFLLTYTMMYFAIFLSVTIACVKLASGEIDISSAMLILMLSFSFFSSVRELTNATHSALTGVAAAQNVSDLFDIETDRKFTHNSPVSDSTPGIRLEDVKFGYKGRDPILKGINMSFEEGKVTAIVGPSGCGKSTIAAMLLRFLDPESGRLTFDGRPYTDLTLEELRKKVIMVPQRVSLFSGTVRDNLLIANPNADDKTLWKALEDVDLAPWLKNFANGLDTDVGDSGGKLSGGQRQKIGIARALLSSAPYIIFDEATSSVDLESEEDIWNCIDRLSYTHTLIIISHRLSTIRRADKIYVIQKGAIAGAGKHDELIETCPLYANMVEEQNILEAMGKEAVGYESK